MDSLAPHLAGVAPLRHELITRGCAPLACRSVGLHLGPPTFLVEKSRNYSSQRTVSYKGWRFAAQYEPLATHRALANSIAATNSGKTDIPWDSCALGPNPESRLKILESGKQSYRN